VKDGHDDALLVRRLVEMLRKLGPSPLALRHCHRQLGQLIFLHLWV
jgi:hypothetical protein